MRYWDRVIHRPLHGLTSIIEEGACSHAPFQDLPISFLLIYSVITIPCSYSSSGLLSPLFLIMGNKDIHLGSADIARKIHCRYGYGVNPACTTP